MLKNLFKKYIYKITAPNNKTLVEGISELMWANIYHDTINGKKWAKNISISPYGMAANYSLLYLLTRILSEFDINSILEFGLGQSSKFINAFIEGGQHKLIHNIIEHDQDWINFFNKNITPSSNIIHKSLGTVTFEDESIQLYQNLTKNIKLNYELYLVDGPNGLTNNSRYDICILARQFVQNDQFIIIMDDFQRKGEQETINKLRNILKKKEIIYFEKIFEGSTTQYLLVTEKYKFALTF